MKGSMDAAKSADARATELNVRLKDAQKCAMDFEKDSKDMNV